MNEDNTFKTFLFLLFYDGSFVRSNPQMIFIKSRFHKRFIACKYKTELNSNSKRCSCGQYPLLCGNEASFFSPTKNLVRRGACLWFLQRSIWRWDDLVLNSHKIVELVDKFGSKFFGGSRMVHSTQEGVIIVLMGRNCLPVWMIWCPEFPQWRRSGSWVSRPLSSLIKPILNNHSCSLYRVFLPFFSWLLLQCNQSSP